MGTTPNNTDNQLIINNGDYCGCASNEWVWNFSYLKELNEEELWELYLMCKK